MKKTEDSVQKEKKKKIKVDTFCKFIVAAVMLHGFVLSTASYVLSYLGRDTVYEVSTVIVSEILAPVVTYLATNMIANIFEKNKLSFSTPLTHEYMMSKEDSHEYKEVSNEVDEVDEPVDETDSSIFPEAQ